MEVSGSVVAIFIIKHCALMPEGKKLWDGGLVAMVSIIFPSPVRIRLGDLPNIEGGAVAPMVPK